jgi:hypothetical protein
VAPEPVTAIVTVKLWLESTLPEAGVTVTVGVKIAMYVTATFAEPADPEA